MNRIGQAGLVAVGLSLLTGCDTIGNPIEALTGKPKAPDEFQVLARKPLRMPATLDLPEPRLGEPSPLEPDPQSDAVVALLGVPALGTTGSPASPGEAALLSAATAGVATGAERDRLDAQIDEFERNQPYRPPSLLDVLEGEETVRDVIVPAPEARRIQSEGIAPAPIDPDELPPEEAQ